MVGAVSVIQRDVLAIYGVDFSGDERNAGRFIWIACGRPVGEVLRIEACLPARALPGSGAARETAHRALRNFLEAQPGCAVGMDFPFGLPQALLKSSSWREFVQSFPERYPSPEAFRDSCRLKTGGRELKRRTEVETRTPFAPYNLRLYRQTYFGIRDVLRPLVLKGAASVIPLQHVGHGRLKVLEVCPASTLKRAGRYRPAYKGRSREARSARARILRWLAQRRLAIPRPVRLGILDEVRGNALDAVLAVDATYRALADPQPRATPAHRLEGYVYV